MTDLDPTPEQLSEAALAAVRKRPGLTSADVTHLLPVMLAEAGLPARALSRDQVKALLRELEQRAAVTRRAEQARVGFYPAEAAGE